MPLTIPSAKNLQSHYHKFSIKYVVPAISSTRLFHPDTLETKSVHLISSISSIIIKLKDPYKSNEEKMKFYKNAFYGLILLEHEEAFTREYKLDLKTIFHIDGELQDPEAQGCLRNLEELLDNEVAEHIAPYKIDLKALKDRIERYLFEPKKPVIIPANQKLLDIETQEYDNIPLPGKDEFKGDDDELYVVLSDGSPAEETSGTALSSRCGIY